MGLNQKAAGTRGRVVYLVSFCGLGQLDQQTHHLRRGIELAALLAGAVRKILNQVFIGRPEQVGKLEIIVDQNEARLVKMIEQVLPLLVRYLGLALDRVEIDVVLQHPGQ